LTTYAAFWPRPGSTIELKAYWNERPQKKRPGAKTMIDSATGIIGEFQSSGNCPWSGPTRNVG
jgi:hypothetical protein